MSDIRVMVKDCQDREQQEYMYRNMMMLCYQISREQGFSLKDPSDVRRVYSSELKEQRRKSVA